MGLLKVHNGAWREGETGTVPGRFMSWATVIEPWDDAETVRRKRAGRYWAGLSGTDVADIADAYVFWKANPPEERESVHWSLPADPCERAAVKWSLYSSEFDMHVEEFDGLSTITAAIMDMSMAEARHWSRSESQTFSYSYEKEALAYKGDPDDFCYVRFVKCVLGWRPGDVIATSTAIGAKWDRHAQAKLISHEEAQAYADRQKQIAGGWMDAPAWRSFVANFKRVLCAERLKRAA